MNRKEWDNSGAEDHNVHDYEGCFDMASALIDVGFERRAWEQMADRLESAWWRIGSEENQDLYFALDEARSHAARLQRLKDYPSSWTAEDIATATRRVKNESMPLDIESDGRVDSDD